MKRQDAEIKDLLHPAQANLGYFFVWFQSLQLPSTQSESPIALIPLAPKSHVSFEVSTQLWTEFFIFLSGLTVTWLARVYCIWLPCFPFMVLLWADIPRTFLGNGSVNTFPLLGSRFLIMQQLDYNTRRTVFSTWSVSIGYKRDEVEA
jgi:hypothetical protein